MIEQELLAIIELLKEFRNMLFGQRLKIHTDHKTLMYDNTTFSCNRVLRQQLFLEKVGPETIHIEGGENIGADALSRKMQLEREQKVNDKNLMSQHMETFAQEQTPNPINYYDKREIQKDMSYVCSRLSSVLIADGYRRRPSLVCLSTRPN